jgi:hypothetical protein
MKHWHRHATGTCITGRLIPYTKGVSKRYVFTKLTIRHPWLDLLLLAANEQTRPVVSTNCIIAAYSSHLKCSVAVMSDKIHSQQVKHVHRCFDIACASDGAKAWPNQPPVRLALAIIPVCIRRCDILANSQSPNGRHKASHSTIIAAKRTKLNANRHWNGRQQMKRPVILLVLTVRESYCLCQCVFY